MWEEEAMKSLLLLAIVPVVGLLSMPAAQAESKCSSSLGFRAGPVPCGPRYAVNYEACRKYVMDRGETGTSAMYYCTTQGYRK